MDLRDERDVAVVRLGQARGAYGDLASVLGTRFIAVCRFGVVNGAGTDNQQEPVVFPHEDIPDFVPGATKIVGLGIGAGDFTA